VGKELCHRRVEVGGGGGARFPNAQAAAAINVQLGLSNFGGLGNRLINCAFFSQCLWIKYLPDFYYKGKPTATNKPNK